MNSLDIISSCKDELRDVFSIIDNIALSNQEKVLNAFKNNSIALRHFAPTSGYGYDDIGRDSLNKVYAEVFGAEDAIVSPHLLSGTHALCVGLFGLLMPKDKMLSITGMPYDTIRPAIFGKDTGSLADYGINYDEIPLNNGQIDIDKVCTYLRKNKVKLVYLQRSRGYEWRNAFTIEDLKLAIEKVRTLSNAIIYVDNCYGEFTDTVEPTQVGADIIAGSLIKNAGGGLAPTGGYICGKSSLIAKIENRLTTPNVGREVGSYAGDYRLFYQGLFLAPHVTAQALKGALLFSKAFTEIGYETLPRSCEKLGDIICSIKFGDKDKLIKFCQCVQGASPIDSFAIPEPWDMPGYSNQVIMASGSFVQGSSIEISADAPIKEPFIAYVQGGLTFEHIQIVLKRCIDAISS